MSPQEPRNRRAPLSPLESSLTDAVADEFRAKGIEPNLADMRKMVAPIRYCTGDFRVYPLVLGDFEFPRKVRLLSDGSQLHLGIETYKRCCGVESPSYWFGPALRVRLGAGPDAQVVDAQPRWLNGFLPVACFEFERQGVRYGLEAFACILPDTTEALAAFVRVTMTRVSEGAGRFELRLEGDGPLEERDGYLFGGPADDAELRGGFSDGWRFDAQWQSLTLELPPGQERIAAQVVLLDQPAHWTLLEEPSRFMTHEQINRGMCLEESGSFLRELAQDRWQECLDRYAGEWTGRLEAGAAAGVSEEYVVAAQKSVRISSWILAARGQMNYSAHNAYERVYTDEACQAIVGLAHWGHFADAARYLGTLRFYNQKGVEPHEYGSRLIWYCRYVALSDDWEFLRRHLTQMRRWASRLLELLGRGERGLLPPTGHSGDLKHIQVLSLSSNCLAWRGLRDLAVLTADHTLLERAESYRQDIRCAADASLDAAADPPFLPMSLYGQEKTPAHLMESSLSAYWCLMAPYALFGNALGDSHAGTRSIVETFKRRGGLCGGLVKFTGHSEFGECLTWEEFGIDDLYGCKLSEAFARMDEPDQLTLALYGKLALGLTRETFYCGESSSLVPTHLFDQDGSDGRATFLPPNSASQMFLATLLRHMLVFDFDSREDGRYDTLRLAFSTPRAWLEEGKRIEVRGLPTAFGEVSYSLQSRIISRRAIDADIHLPRRSLPQRTLLRLRVPLGRLLKVAVAGREYQRFDGAMATIDLSGLTGCVVLRAEFAP